MTHNDAIEYCQELGARLCTVGELIVGDVARGSGCSGDLSYHWTADGEKECPSGQFFKAHGSSKPSSPTAKCERKQKKMRVRCCADIIADNTVRSAAVSSLMYPPSTETFESNPAFIDAKGSGSGGDKGRLAGATGAALAAVAVVAVGLVFAAVRMRSSADLEDPTDSELDLEVGDHSNDELDHPKSGDGPIDIPTFEEEPTSPDFAEGGYQLNTDGTSLRIKSIKRENPLFAPVLSSSRLEAPSDDEITNTSA